MPSARRAGVFLSTKAGTKLPKIIVLNDDIDPDDVNELAWAFATRCHPTVGNVVFPAADTPPLAAFLRKNEKLSGSTTKIVYNCLPPDECGDALPVRSSFRHGYPREIVGRVERRWSEYGFV